MRTGPNIRKRADGRYEARYERARDAAGRIVYGYCYGRTYEEAAAKRSAVLGDAPKLRAVRGMHLLILGAGSQGPVVKEAAEALGVFRRIAYLDDDPENRLAIDSCANFEKYIDSYPIALPSFGNCRLRAEWIERLETAGFIVPTLIHPMATISPSAQIGTGVMVEAKVIVSTNASIGKGCIVSSGAVVDINSSVGAYCHIGCAATIKRNAQIADYTVIESGTAVDAAR